MLFAYSSVVGLLLVWSALIFFRAASLYEPGDTAGAAIHLVGLLMPTVLVLVVGLPFGLDLQASATFGLVAAAPLFLCVVAAGPIAAFGLVVRHGPMWPKKVLFALGAIATLAILWVVLFANMH